VADKADNALSAFFAKKRRLASQFRK